MENKVIGIIILVLIAVGVVVFTFLQYFKETGTIQIEEEILVEEEIVYPAIGPDEVVQAFYRWYLDDDNRIPSENYVSANSLTDKFKETVSRQIAATENLPHDPFLCTNADPLEMNTGTTNIIETRANVVVDNILSDVEIISFIAELILQDNAWKIDNIVCFIKG